MSYGQVGVASCRLIKLTTIYELTLSSAKQIKKLDIPIAVSFPRLLQQSLILVAYKYLKYNYSYLF